MILIILFVLSIFFPFVWFLFFGYLVWIFLTKKYKRNNLLRTEIFKLINSGDTSVVLLEDVYYGDAKKYALDCGATFAPHTRTPNESLFFDVSLDGVKYLVNIDRAHDDATFMSVDNLSAKSINDVIDDINLQEFGESLSEIIMDHIKNKDQANALAIQLLNSAEMDYTTSFFSKGRVYQDLNNLGLDLGKYPNNFKYFYIKYKKDSEKILKDKYSGDAIAYDPRKESDPRLSGLDMFEINKPFDELTIAIKDPEKCLEIKFFIIDSILNKWNAY